MRAREITQKVAETLEALRLKSINISGADYPLLSWVEGSYECAMIVEPRRGEYAVAVYGGYNLNKSSLNGLEESSDWSSKKVGFKNPEDARVFFEEHAKTIKSKGGLAETGFPKGWGEFFGLTDEVLAGLSSKTES